VCREIQRVLRRAEPPSLVWTCAISTIPCSRGVEELLDRSLRLPGQIAGAWRKPLALSDLFGRRPWVRFTYEQQVHADAFGNRVASRRFRRGATAGPEARGCSSSCGSPARPHRAVPRSLPLQDRGSLYPAFD